MSDWRIPISKSEEGAADYRVAVSGILIYHGEILLAGKVDPDGQTLWAPPGGKVEEGESFRGAVVREFKEETNLNIEPVVLLGSLEVGIRDVRYLIFDYLVKLSAGSLIEDIRPGDDVGQLKLFKVAGLNEVTFAPGVRRFLEQLIPLLRSLG